MCEVLNSESLRCGKINALFKKGEEKRLRWALAMTTASREAI